MQRLVLCAVVHAASRAGDAGLELPVYARVIQRPPIVEDGADRDFGDGQRMPFAPTLFSEPLRKSDLAPQLDGSL
jgi:hypothetical protein